VSRNQRGIEAMKVGVVSDVHNNVAALSYALEYLAGCELILNLGDLVFEYRVDHDIIRLAREAGLVSILGNHEKTILLHPASSLRSQLAPDVLAYLESLPPSRDMVVSGAKLHLTHGAPWDDPNDPRCAYVYERNAASMNRLASVPADIILMGHTHVAMLTRVGEKLVINPGSCGDARGANERLTFGELNFDEGTATVFGICKGGPPERLLQVPYTHPASTT
jgi:putative phosphoesterase